MAACRILDEAVLQSIHRIASLQRCFVNSRIFLGRDVASWLFVDRLSYGDRPDMQMRLVIGGSAGDDAVEIGWKTLRFFQALAAAGGAAIPVGVARIVAIEACDYRFTGDRGFMHGAVCEI